MCLTIKRNQAKIAGKDITCYKSLTKRDKKNIWFSPYMSFEYRIGVLYKLDKPLKPIRHGNEYDINEGFHSFVNGSDCDDEQTRFKCTIPKGAKYYTGQFINQPSYASDQIRVDVRVRHITDGDKYRIRQVMDFVKEKDTEVMRRAFTSSTEDKFKAHINILQKNDLADEVLYVRLAVFANPNIMMYKSFIEWTIKNADAIINP